MPNTVLLLDLPKGPEAIICMLASLQLNMPFVNLNAGANDVEYHRLLEQFNDAILITGRTFDRHFLPWASSNWRNIALTAPGDNTHFTFFQRQRPGSNAELPAGIGYIMFTSGTTGTSKGVMCSRRSLNVFTSAATERYGIEPSDRVLQFAPLHFDASIEEIFITLASGASLYVASETTTHSFPSLFDFCTTHRISLLDLPTAYFNEMLFALGDKLRLPPTLSTVIVGGESLSDQARKLWFSHHPSGRRLINSYGPTEATVVATTAEVKNDDAPITIGTPLTGIFTAIVGDNLAPVPIGCSGELLIAGATVCAGYLNQPSLSAEKFISIEINGQQMPAYRTGDIACLDQARQLLFLGRKVRETKIAGQRVNMSEIEECITTLPDVIEVAVLAKTESSKAGAALCAYYHSPRPLDEQTRRTLYGKLPNALIPKHFVHHPAPLAKLPNGKIDYRTLEQQPHEATPKYELRSMTFKALVQDTWLSILGSDESNFFTLGGDSLQAIKIINVLNAHCQLNLNLWDIFEHPSLTEFCRHLVQLGHSRFGLSEWHLDLRCIISHCLSADTGTSTGPVLFIQSPNGSDEGYLLEALAAGHYAQILSSEQELHTNAQWPLTAAVLSLPETPPQYVAWLNTLPALLLTLCGRVQKMIFLHSETNGAWLVNDLLRDYHHEKLLLLRKADHRLQVINDGIAELITLSVQLGYFPHIQFDTTNELLSSCVLKSIGVEDKECVDHHAAFAAVQQRNPGVQLCGLSQWLNLVSVDSNCQPSNQFRPPADTNAHMEGAKS